LNKKNIYIKKNKNYSQKYFSGLPDLQPVGLRIWHPVFIKPHIFLEACSSCVSNLWITAIISKTQPHWVWCHSHPLTFVPEDLNHQLSDAAFKASVPYLISFLSHKQKW